MTDRAPGKACKLDVIVQSGPWRGAGKIKALLRRAVEAAAAELSTGRVELAIVLTDDSEIRLLNRQWRAIDKATNVLSFPAHLARGQPRLIGDIVLAYETIAKEADAEARPFAHHLAHLAVHGFLHLNGFDHERDKDAEVMEQLERTILRRLRIPDPYRRAAATAKKSAKMRAMPR